MTIIEFVRHGGVGDLQRREVIGDPAGGPAAQGVELANEHRAPDPVDRLAGRTPAHRQDDGAVFERGGQATDQGDHARAPGGEELGFLAGRAHDEGGGASVSRVDDAPEG